MRLQAFFELKFSSFLDVRQKDALARADELVALHGRRLRQQTLDPAICRKTKAGWERMGKASQKVIC